VDDHEFVFDVKLFASFRVKAKTELEARMKLSALRGCATVCWGEPGNQVTGEASADDGEDELVKIDNEDPEDLKFDAIRGF
jgi:hypothetical protein